jgi:hypothetical protein
LLRFVPYWKLEEFEIGHCNLGPTILQLHKRRAGDWNWPKNKTSIEGKKEKTMDRIQIL